jgi:type I restriction-modification system DNA methylase subunit
MNFAAAADQLRRQKYAVGCLWLLKGVAFEEFMGGFFKGDFGQYFTPRELIGFAVEVLNPERKQLILDPACGSGGFLLYALDHVRREADRRFPSHLTNIKQSVDHRLTGTTLRKRTSSTLKSTRS